MYQSGKILGVKRMITGISFIFVIILFIAQLTTAGTLEVGPGLTYRTIQDAVDAANDGDEIIIHNGVYDEVVEVLGYLDLYIHAAENENVLLQGSLQFQSISAYNNYDTLHRVENIMIRPSERYSSSGISGISDNFLSRFNTYKNVTIFNGQSSNPAIRGSSMYGNSQYENCTIYNCDYGGSYGYASGADMKNCINAFDLTQCWQAPNGSRACTIRYSDFYHNPDPNGFWASNPLQIVNLSWDSTCIKADPKFISTDPLSDYFLWISEDGPAFGTASGGANMGSKPSGPASLALNDVPWNIRYYADELPGYQDSVHDTPAWWKIQSGTGTSASFVTKRVSTIPDIRYSPHGVLLLNTYNGTPAASMLYYAQYASDNPNSSLPEEVKQWDVDFGTIGATVQAHVCLWGRTTAATVYASDGAKYAYFTLSGDPNDPALARQVVLKGTTQVVYNVDTTKWHKYRLVCYGDTAYLYVDNMSSAVATVSLAGVTEDAVLFWGDSGTGQVVAKWDYVAAYTGGAVPGPAPSLISTTPSSAGTLYRKGNNVIKFQFADSVTIPAVPMIVTETGLTTDIANEFSYSLETTVNADDTLVMTEEGVVMSNNKWYTFSPSGDWAASFSVDFPVLYGDISMDRVVTMKDLAAISSYWLDAGYLISSDLNVDSVINFKDFEVLASNWLVSMNPH